MSAEIPTAQEEGRESRSKLKEAIVKGARVALIGILLGVAATDDMSKPKESAARRPEQRIESMSY